MSRILSGIRPTGDLHLGNYLGAIQQWLALQDRHEVFYMVADLHAITTPYDPKELPSLVRNTVIDYLAAGLDPAKATIFIQSHVPAHSQLMWLLNVLVSFGDLYRMNQWKEKSSAVIAKSADYAPFIEKMKEFIDRIDENKFKDAIHTNRVREFKKETFEEFIKSEHFNELLNREKKDILLNALMGVKAGLLNYPLLMAADILAYKPESVPVGDDQDQHVEIARDLAKKMNRLFGTNFPEPKSLHTGGKRIMDLVHPDQKMSKSFGGGILLIDSPDAIEKKLKKAVSSAEPRVIREAMKAAKAGAKATDREWKGDANLQKQYHGVRNLFTILLALGNTEQVAHWDALAETGELKFAEFKPVLATVIADHFAPFRERRVKFSADTKFVDQVIADGAKKARAVAEATLLEVQQKMGLR